VSEGEEIVVQSCYTENTFPIQAVIARQGGIMKRFLPLFVVFALFIAACEYQEPLSEKQGILIDESSLGLWEALPEKDGKPPKEYILALKISPTEYLVHYKMESDSMYFRAYPIKVGNISCLQLQLIGTSTGPAPKNEPQYQVALYQIKGDELSIRMMNTSVVGEKLGSAAMREAFLKNQTNEKLFREPGKFKRVKKS
jgi:hypothetical protein